MLELLHRLFCVRVSNEFVVPNDAVAREFINRMTREAAPVIFRKTVGIYGADARARPYILGTAIPLELAGRRFVVTAAHVMDDVLRMNHGVYLSPGISGGKLIDLNGCPVHRTQIPEGAARKTHLTSA
jgi:hypothetical protein